MHLFGFKLQKFSRPLLQSRRVKDLKGVRGGGGVNAQFIPLYISILFFKKRILVLLSGVEKNDRRKIFCYLCHDFFR